MINMNDSKSNDILSVCTGNLVIDSPPVKIKIGSRREGFPNNKGADQSAHPRRLISAFVTRCLESIKSNLATVEISIF